MESIAARIKVTPSSPADTGGRAITTNKEVLIMTKSILHEKNEVSRLYYTGFIAITFVMASGLAIQNALYGYEQGTNEARAIVTGALFFVGDLALIALCHKLFPALLAQLFGLISIIGFAILSMFAAFAFLVGQQHHKDNYQITSKQEQVNRLDNHYNNLPVSQVINRRDTLREIRILNNKIDKLSEQNGGYVSSGSAAYLMISKATPYSFEQVSLIIRLAWSLVFVIGSMALGGMISTMKIRKKVIVKNDTRKESDEPASGANTRTQPSTAHAHDDKFKIDVDSMVKHLKGITDGKTITLKYIKGEAKTTDAQTKIIRDQLKKMKWLKKGGNGAAAQYKKATPKSIEKPAEATAEPVKKSNVFNFLARKS